MTRSLTHFARSLTAAACSISIGIVSASFDSFGCGFGFGIGTRTSASAQPLRHWRGVGNVGIAASFELSFSLSFSFSFRAFVVAVGRISGQSKPIYSSLSHRLSRNVASFVCCAISRHLFDTDILCNLCGNPAAIRGLCLCVSKLL